MVRIGARIHDLAQDSGNDLTGILKNTHAETAQLALPKFASGGEPVGGFSQKQLQEIKYAFDNANIPIRVLSCYINPLSKDARKEQEKFFRYIDYAKEMGVSIVGTETGSVVSDLREFSKNHTEEVFLQLIDNFRPILEYAERRGVAVGVESVAYFPVCDEKTFGRFQETFLDKAIVSIFDATNLLHVGNYTEQKTVFERFIKAHAKDIRAVHLKDFDVVNDWLEERPLFSGKLDVACVLELLKRYGVQADVIVENAPSIQAFKEIKTKLKEMINRSI